MKRHTRRITILTLALGAATVLLTPGIPAHCDALDGPVVTEAREALQSGDVTPVLKWVTPADEAQIREAFSQAVEVRALGAEAQELADRHFFETLVRVHRASEGEPFTGLLPAGTPLEPGIAEAEAALRAESAAALTAEMSQMISEGVQARFDRVIETRQHADESVDAGRRHVAAYVEYIHYVKRLHIDATTPAAHHPAGAHGAAITSEAHGHP